MKIDYKFINNLRSKIRMLERELDLQLKSETTCCGVTLAQCHIILEMVEKGESSVKELSETFGLDKSTLSRTIDSLVESGYINRDINKEDRRFFKLSLTKKGKEKAEFINSQCNGYYAEIMKNIPGEKQEMILEGISVLGRIMADLRKCCGTESPECCKKTE